MKIIKDPVHGFVEVDDTALRLLDSPPLQRLRYVKQLGFTYLVYPGAIHTRFEHSLGTMHLAVLMCRKLSLSPAETLLVASSALLHDIGHGPFSHALEPFMQEFLGWGHLDAGARLIREGIVADLLERAGIEPAEAAEMVIGRHPLSGIIHGDLDVDRMDYLLRDAHYTGVPYGTVDAHRLIQGTIRTDAGLMLDESGIHAAESLLIARTLMRPSVYFHHVSRIAESMLAYALHEHLREGGDLPALMAMDDAEFLLELRRSRSAAARRMAEAVYRRQLFKRALYVGSDRVNVAALQSESGYASSRRFAQDIAERASLDEGEVLVDIPPMPRDMAVQVRVQNRHTATVLEELSPLITTLNETRRQQWRMGVYVPAHHRDKVEAAATEVFHVKKPTRQDKLPVE
ncbi:MAG: HD domain-containing protein [Methanomicrobiales archaeon]|nr:HD domain-containing protein [Methanomicrobiales archaeon]